MPEKPQSSASHAKIDPLFHYFLMPVAFINVCIVVYLAIRRPSYSALWLVILSMAFAVAVFKIRTYSLKVQDRVIRLEETLRMQRLMPPGTLAQIDRLHPHHFIALRFAPDEELPGLVEQTLANSWGPKDIKGAIKNWRSDHFRV